MKIVVDRSKCMGVGICESLAPGAFQVDDAGDLVLLTDEVPAGMATEIDHAVAGCPTGALCLQS